MKEISFEEIEAEYGTEERAFRSSDGRYVISETPDSWFLQIMKIIPTDPPGDIYEMMIKENDLQRLKEKAKDQFDLVLKLDVGKLEEE